MSKSLGNVYTLKQLKEKGIEPLAYRLFCYTAHYRTSLNFTFEGAMSSQKALNRLREGYLKHKEGKEKIDKSVIDGYKMRFLETINDDLNIPSAMGIVWEMVRNGEKSKQIADLLLEFDKVLGLDIINSKKYIEEQADIEIPEDILKLMEERKKARAEKKWELSDKLRDEIQNMGYIVKDTKEGMTLEKM